MVFSPSIEGIRRAAERLVTAAERAEAILNWIVLTGPRMGTSNEGASMLLNRSSARVKASAAAITEGRILLMVARST